MTEKLRCPYKYISLTQSFTQDNRCILNEGHQGEHIKKEYFPPAQPARIQQGWIKDQ